MHSPLRSSGRIAAVLGAVVARGHAHRADKCAFERILAVVADSLGNLRRAVALYQQQLLRARNALLGYVVVEVLPRRFLENARDARRRDGELVTQLLQ